MRLGHIRKCYKLLDEKEEVEELEYSAEELVEEWLKEEEQLALAS